MIDSDMIISEMVVDLLRFMVGIAMGCVLGIRSVENKIYRSRKK